jgi:hypothetical protein
MPPNGWARKSADPNKPWRVSYNRLDGMTQSSYQLTGVMAGSGTVKVPAGEFAATIYRYKGYLTRGSLGAAPGRGHYAATVWYSEELKRPVRFEVEAKSVGNYGIASFIIKEQLELSRLPAE